MTVYADVLVVVNYIVNLLLLLASAKLLGVVTCRWRLCAGALVGALGSLVIFLPYVGMWFQALYKILARPGDGGGRLRRPPVAEARKGPFCHLCGELPLRGAHAGALPPARRPPG